LRRYTVDDLRYTVGQNIRKARTEKRMTQLRLAELCGMKSGKSGSQTICNIERGLHFPYPRSLTRIADALEADVFSFFKKLD
jgi:transcriptional regulator with XRE-family HTH domain